MADKKREKEHGGIEMEFDKSKVYTALNADEVKVGSRGYFADNIQSLKRAVSEGEEADIEEVYEVHPECRGNRFESGGALCYDFFYLIEEPEEKKFRPYKDTDEMIEDFKKRFNVNVPSYAIPLIWVKTKGADKKYLIVRFASALTICLNVEVYTPTLEDLVEGYTYLDGSPCGIEE